MTAILQANEKICEVTKPWCVLKSIDWNQLAFDNPLEDSLAIAQLWDNKSIWTNHYFTSKSYSIISLYSKVTCRVFSTVMEVWLALEFRPNVSSLTLQPPSLLNKSQANWLNKWLPQLNFGPKWSLFTLTSSGCQWISPWPYSSLLSSWKLSFLSKVEIAMAMLSLISQQEVRRYHQRPNAKGKQWEPLCLASFLFLSSTSHIFYSIFLLSPAVKCTLLKKSQVIT